MQQYDSSCSQWVVAPEDTLLASLELPGVLALELAALLLVPWRSKVGRHGEQSSDSLLVSQIKGLQMSLDLAGTIAPGIREHLIGETSI